MSQVSTERKAANKRLRSTWPRAGQHGKHVELQGYPNTRGKSPQPKQKRDA